MDIVINRSGEVYFNIFSSARYTNRELVKLVGNESERKLEVMAQRKAEGGNLLGLALADDSSFYFGDMQDRIAYRLWPTK